jgi:hypothetical protein
MSPHEYGRVSLASNLILKAAVNNSPRFSFHLNGTCLTSTPVVFIVDVRHLCVLRNI